MAVAASSLILAVDNLHTEYIAGLAALDGLLTCAFIVELVLRMSRDGVVCHRGAVLRSTGGLCDALFVLASVVEIVVRGILMASNGAGSSVQSTSGLASGRGAAEIAISIARVIRCVRPLRLLSVSDSVALVGVALGESLMSILNVLGIVLLAWFILAVLGVQLFAGAFRRCSDPLFPEGALLDPPDGWTTAIKLSPTVS